MNILFNSYSINGKIISIWKKETNNEMGGGQFYLTKESRVITPLVSRIFYEEKMESFLICDEITTWNHIKGHLYYYVDDYGVPVSNVFNDLNDMVYPIEKTSSYLKTYDEKKLEIAEELGDIFTENFYKRKKEMESEVANELGL